MINEVHFGDCRDSLRVMAAMGVKAQMCVTSPPYFGLRDYGVDGQIGHEETPEQFIAELVDVFRCVRDVLADDGTLWVNIGDSYASSPPGNKTVGVSAKSGLNGVNNTSGTYRETLAGGHATKRDTSKLPGIKQKDLIGIPWMLAFALRADGWYLRQDIIWHKPNPMPESVRDRCTKAHEYVFLLSKSPKYFCDMDAVQEDAVKGYSGSTFTKGKTAEHQLGRSSGTERVEDGKRNRRSVWSIASRPYKGAHFAVFPPDLIEPPILAGTSERGHCPECGARWARQVERTPMVIAKTDRNEDRGTRTGTSGTMVSPATTTTTGWTPGCECGADPVPDVVLDPFMGSGTTAAVSIEHGRQWVGCELNREYEALQDERIANAYIKALS